jgi:hypothetical protein
MAITFCVLLVFFRPTLPQRDLAPSLGKPHLSLVQGKDLLGK